MPAKKKPYIGISISGPDGPFFTLTPIYRHIGKLREKSVTADPN